MWYVGLSMTHFDPLNSVRLQICDLYDMANVDKLISYPKALMTFLPQLIGLVEMYCNGASETSAHLCILHREQVNSNL